MYVVTEIQAQGEIDASSKAVRRRIPYEITYTRAKQEMVIEAHNMQAQGCENCRLKCTANREGIKLQFGRGQLQYQVSANGQVQDQGKSLRLQLEWTEVTNLIRLTSPERNKRPGPLIEEAFICRSFVTFWYNV